MAANSFGNRFVVTTFGESHGPALGAVIDGVPSGLRIDLDQIQLFLNRRRPGQWDPLQVVSDRKEPDQFEILSGIYLGTTLGTPIGLMVRNQDQKSEDYSEIKSKPRAGHADDVWLGKFGVSDHRGGGRSSGRETVSRVLAGAIAKQLCTALIPSLRVSGWAEMIGSFQLSEVEQSQAKTIDADSCVGRFPGSAEKQVALKQSLVQAKADGESFGGKTRFVIQNIPAFLGQPVFHKFKNDLASACLSVGATNGFSIGEDPSDLNLKNKGTYFHQQASSVYGGIRGGITTGEEIIFDVDFKPTSSILDTAKKGRHDPCILIRAIPVIEAMTWIVIADHLLWRQTDLLKEHNS